MELVRMYLMKVLSDLLMEEGYPPALLNKE